jgi:hypothetical protein
MLIAMLKVSGEADGIRTHDRLHPKQVSKSKLDDGPIPIVRGRLCPSGDEQGYLSFLKKLTPTLPVRT